MIESDRKEPGQQQQQQLEGESIHPKKSTEEQPLPTDIYRDLISPKLLEYCMKMNAQLPRDDDGDNDEEEEYPRRKRIIMQ